MRSAWLLGALLPRYPPRKSNCMRPTPAKLGANVSFSGHKSRSTLPHVQKTQRYIRRSIFEGTVRRGRGGRETRVGLPKKEAARKDRRVVGKEGLRGWARMSRWRLLAIGYGLSVLDLPNTACGGATCQIRHDEISAHASRNSLPSHHTSRQALTVDAVAVDARG